MTEWKNKEYNYVIQQRFVRFDTEDMTMKNTVYGYARISRPTQNIERQLRNIKEYAPEAVIFAEAYTGTKQNRPEWMKLIEKVQEGDTIVFDSVSRMSRNAEEGMKEYAELYSKGVKLVFLKEHHIDTETYRNAVTRQFDLTGDILDCILKGINEYTVALAKKQVALAFEQAQKEVDDLHQRTAEGMATAKANGKRVGCQEGDKLTTKRSIIAKASILKYSQAFGGSLNDTECIKQCSIARNSFYKYKAALLNEQEIRSLDEMKADYTKQAKAIEKAKRISSSRPEFILLAFHLYIFLPKG